MASTSEILAVEGLSKSFGAVQALQDVSFSLGRQEIRALCGENGAGKSTFVKILMGLAQPDEGIIRVGGDRVRIAGSRHAQNLGLGLVAQELSLAPHLSIFDNIWLGSPQVPFLHRRSALRAKAREALRALGVEDWGLDTLVRSLSVGQRQIVEIARLIAREARILILDEPTATLSDSEIERMMRALRSLRDNGRSILYVSHRLGEVFELCDSVTVFRNGRHVVTRPRQGLDKAELIENILGRTLSEMYPPRVKNVTAPDVLRVQNLSVANAVKDVSFSARTGEILCIAGQLGSGADFVTRALAGLAPAATGKVSFRGKRTPLRSVSKSIAKKIDFISDDRAGEGLFQTMRVLDNLIASNLEAHSRGGLLRWGKLREYARRSAERVGLTAGRLDSPIGALSGGNQQKILFGRVLRSDEPGLLLLNEPTRGIDVGARSELYRVMRMLCENGCVLVMYSSDLEEVLGLADVVLTMFKGRLVNRYEGGEIEGSRILADITHPDARAR